MESERRILYPEEPCERAEEIEAAVRKVTSDNLQAAEGWREATEENIRAEVAKIAADLLLTPEQAAEIERAMKECAKLAALGVEAPDNDRR